MPSGPLWEKLTDNEKLNVLNYLLSLPSVDITRTIFEDVASILVEIPYSEGKDLWTSKEAFQALADKYNIESLNI